MLKIDLHTHSAGSADGSLTAADYAAAISGGLNYVAITDHNDVATAQAIKQQLGKPIIVGEEIMTDSGEIIGLFLSSKIEPFQSLSATVKAIKDQQALVYVPHPFDKLRRAGLSQSSLESIAADIDIIEIKNGRSLLPLHGSLAARLGRRHGWSPAASSDAHGPKGLGRT
ncbi:MAG TPA: PHP domain-containing protein, partial [Candidatus Saccharimonadales bacterium]